MPCLYPLAAWRSKSLNESGKRGITFNASTGLQEHPIDLPCSKCVGCKETQAREWTTRLYCENLYHERSSFLTLTYDDNNLPEGNKINKRDMQLFLKKLRNKGDKLRYFICGEYGGQTKRPHYHAIIFGLDFRSPYEQTIGENMFLYPEMEKYWNKGRVVIAPVTPASIAYVAGYAVKKIGDQDTFNMMSRKPPIGKQYVLDHAKNINDIEGVIVGENKLPVPSVFFEWTDELEPLKGRQIEHNRTLSPEQKWKARAKLRAREININSKIKSRNLKQTSTLT